MWGSLDFTVPVTDVAHAIQLSLGPVFLLNGLGVLLAMLTSRLARIVDRARVLEARLPQASEEEAAEIHRYLAITSRRGRLMNRAITLGTMAALLVALVVVLLFATAFVKFPFPKAGEGAGRDQGHGRLPHRRLHPVGRRFRRPVPRHPRP
jgi:hypothetical protein